MKKNIYLLLISCFTIFVYIALYFLRRLDDNRLTQWQWTIDGANASFILLFLVAGILLSLLISEISFSLKRRGLFLFLVSFAAAALFWKEAEPIVDASRYFTDAKYLELYGIGYFVREWGKEINSWTDLPLVPFLYGLIFKFAGEARIHIQIFNAVLFSLSAVLTYLIGKELWDKDIGFIGGMLLLGIPYLLTQVPLMLVDIPTMFFLLLAICLFIYALQRGGPWVIASSAAIFLSFYSKYSAWLMLSILPILFFVFLIRGGRNSASRYSYRALEITAIAALLIGVVFTYKFDVFSSQVKLLMEYQKPGLRRWGESFISTFLFQVSPLLSGAAVYSVYAAVRKKDVNFIVVLWLILVVFGLQIRRIRYIIMVFPMLCLMASYSIVRIREMQIIKFVTSSILLFSLIIAYFAYLPFIQSISTVNLKDAGAFLNSIPEPNVKIFTPLRGNEVADPAVSVPLLDLYTAKNIVYDYDVDITAVPVKDREESPLRFTWGYRNPPYYHGKYSKADTAFVVISNNSEAALPEHIMQDMADCRLSKKFDAYERIFLFRTSVMIFRCGN